jgi:hypothetical protein
MACYEAAKTACAHNMDAGPFFGWLSTRFAAYPQTLNLKAHVHLRKDARACVELGPTDHPLAIEQREGITLERVEQIVSLVLHACA